jgi:sugar phosphate isomerase/epimerase
VKIAYQLYTSRNALQLTAQFPFLKSLGYDHIEAWPGAYMDSPSEFRRALDDAGLDAPSVLIPDPSDADDLKKFIDVAHVLGAGIIVRPGLPPHRRPTEQDGWKRLAERLSREAAIAEGEQLQFAWHNHDFEFVPLQDGTRPIDLLVANSSPNLCLELDCGWVFQAGADLKAELERFASRIIAIHAKDAAPLGTKEEDGWVAHGDGVIDWHALLPTILSTGAVLAVVEHDEPSDWRYVAKRSYDSLAELFGVDQPPSL